MENNLRELADKLGIATKFADAGMVRREYEVGGETIKFFAKMLGYNADNDKAVEDTLKQIDEGRWNRVLDSIYVVENDKVEFDVVVPSSQASEYLTVELRPEDCEDPLPVSYQVISSCSEKYINSTPYTRLVIRIDTPLAYGYYSLSLKIKNKTYKSVLAISPKCCYEAPSLDKKLWGFAVQLYSVKSARNWGVGDFTDLCTLVKIAAHVGASAIGLNPLNVLMHNFPEEASPYNSISRLFLNPIYIDVEAVPEFMPEDKDEAAAELADLRNAELIQYTRVYNLKSKYLERCYERFKASKNKDRKTAYARFCKEQGEELDKLAIFQTLYDEHCQTVWGGWRAWPEQYRDPSSPAVKEYARQNKDRIDFFKYLQFEADRQFNTAQNLVSDLGLGIGFYRDLAVGVGQDSAELWSNPQLFLAEAGAGAPPDAFFPEGQQWGLGAFEPRKLKEECYRPFIRILRANMKNAGALRIDHVMSLMRLYIIPFNGVPGTYLHYNFMDMINIVALESHLNKCTIVGESIGNVPDGFLDTLRERNIHPLSVLWSERYDSGWGDFISPSGYPRSAFVSLGTHDMPPLRMWWFGYDIELSYSLGLIASEGERTEAYHKRELDRWKLLFALDSNGVWPEDNLRKNNYIFGEGYPEGIEEAVHRFISRTPCSVFLAQFEDILHVEKRQNLPGTDRDKHPNWRRKLPVNLEAIEGDIAYIRNVAAIRTER